jgi:RNA polymerase sigma factor (sigma-70 family)
VAKICVPFAILKQPPKIEFPETTMSETTLFLENCLARLKSGDDRARDELVTRVSRRLMVLSERMLRDYPGVSRWEQADDLFQQASVRLHKCLADVVPATPADFLRLAGLQLRRELIDMARHYFGPNGHGANHASDYVSCKQSLHSVVGDLPDDSGTSPESLAMWTEFHTVVESLPEPERAVFDLLWYHELTQAEAAEVLNVNERQIRRYWQSARLKLRKLMGDFVGE